MMSLNWYVKTKHPLISGLLAQVTFRSNGAQKSILQLDLGQCQTNKTIYPANKASNDEKYENVQSLKV